MTTAAEVVSAAKALVMKVPDFAEKCVYVLSEEDVLSLLKGAKFPMSGIIYNGIVRNGGDPPSRQGIATDLSFTVLVFVQGNAIGALDEKNNATNLLDSIRAQFRANPVSPTGHRWQFQREAPALVLANAAIYKQTWTTPFMAL